MSNKIRHVGIIDSIREKSVQVRILQSSACSGCKVVSHCNAAETKEKLIEVAVDEPSCYQVGEKVVIVADASVGFIASLYGYLLPLLLMVLTLVIVLGATHSEGVAAFSALGILVPYYTILYLTRNRLGNQLTFEILR